MIKPKLTPAEFGRHVKEMLRRYDCQDALVAALQDGITLYEGDLVGTDWHKAVHAWLEQARAALAAARSST